MATQVKFYSVPTLPDASKITAGGIYFVGGPKNGELYKGATRFGAGRVTEVANLSAAPSDAIRGDIAVCAVGGAYAYDGTKWVAIGPDLAAVKKSWQSDITSAINALDFSFVGASAATSIITGIKQVDGKIVAHAEAFPQLTSPSDGHVSLNGTDVAIKGWASLVADKDDLESRVSGLETWKGNITGDEPVAGTKVTAETGKFNNLTVAETASFTATTVKATNLTVDTEAGATFGGSTISQIADREALAKIAAIPATTKSATAGNVVTVSVTTSAGSVNKVDVAVQKAEAIGPATGEGAATHDKLATEKAVRDALTSLDNAMHFTGVVTSLPASGKAGDIVVIGPAAEGATLPNGLVAGQEYIYDGKKWELIGDQKSYASNAYSKAGSTVMSGVTTVPKALDALAGAVDTINGEGEGSVKKSLVDAKAYTDGKIADLDSTASGGTQGVAISVGQTDGKLNAEATVTITKATLNSTLGTTNVADKTVATTIGATGVDTALATEKAVRDAIKSSELVWLGADGNALA